MTWPGSFNHNTGGTAWSWSSCTLFKPTQGFSGVVVANKQYPDVSATTITCVPPANPMRRPGGLVLAYQHMNSGGSGVTGVSAASAAAGWQVSYAAGLGQLAFFILPMDRIIDAPTVVFTSNRGAGRRAGLVYLR